MNEPARPPSAPSTACAPTRATDPRPAKIAFRERLGDLLPAVLETPAGRKLGQLPVHGARLDASSAGPSPSRASGRPSPLLELELRRADRPADADTGRSSSPEPAVVIEGDLAPFRVGPSILAPPTTRAAIEPPVLDPALFSAELVESMRVGRFGRDGHAMTMRVRGTRGPIDVDLRHDRGALSLRISDPELADRVRSDLAARGVDIEIEIVS